MKRLVLCLSLALGPATPALAELVPSLSSATTAPIAWSLDRKEYSTVHFDFDRDFLDARAKAKLQKQAVFIKRHKGVRFAVTGHTDKVGNQAYNEALGLRRAKRVVAYLVSLGVDSSQLRAMVSLGEEQPVVDVDDRERLNRRVTTTVLMPKRSRLIEAATGGTGSVGGSKPPAVKTSGPVADDSTIDPPASPEPQTTSKSKSRVNAGRGNGDEPRGDPAGSVGKNRGGDETG